MPANTSKVQLPTLAPEGVLTAHQAVTDRIRDAIIAGELPGGTRLVQAELARSLSVSITPVREALRDLIADGLVDFDAFRGATVHETTLTELDELYELRRTLVPIAVRAAVKEITDEELDVAEQLAQRMRSLKDPGGWVRLNRQFHSVLDGASRRPHLQEILGRLADLSALYIGLSISGVKGRRTRGDRDHLAMVELYRAGDVDGAVKLALSHLTDTVDVARGSVVERP